ncbi:ferric iron uptake transcriptional regulator [Celerinatantimonas yamalensis]|uniref:Ferric uptake regulation protein n=1 Tax=Celerinatantimonas yamalensis TaxID=559956 RepID=A0ABW9G4S2_9GAMM
MSRLKTLLKQAGLKITAPRLTILNTLEMVSSRHISAEDLYKQLLDNGETMGLATVYRVLNQFAESGLVTRHNFTGNNAIYERTQHYHDHLICQRCGKIIEFSDACINERLEAIAKQHNICLTTKELTLFGICQCSQK